MFYDKVDGEFPGPDGIRRIPLSDTKKCRRCGVTHLVDAFEFEPNSMDRRANVCGGCRQQLDEASRKKRKAKAALHHQL